MTRYIDADKFVKRVIQYPRQSTKTIGLALADTPTADVMEVRHGKWIWMGEKGDSRFMCSVCRSKENVPTCNGEPTIWWFCPNCGADMRKETEDEN